MPALKYTDAVASRCDALIPTISPLIEDDGAPHRLIRVGTWTFTQWCETGEDEPRILDLELARRLNYENPYNIRKLIRKLRSEGKLNDVRLFSSQEKSGRPGTEYWLTEAQALKVIAKSETVAADELLDEVIRVFMLARRGLLPSAAPMKVEIDPAHIAAIVAPIVGQALTAAMAPMFAKLTALETRMVNVEATAKPLSIDGVIGTSVARTVVLSELVRIAEMASGVKSMERAHQVARSKADAELRSALGWSGKARKWANLPQVRIGEATVKLQEMAAKAADAAKARKAIAMPLFDRFKDN